MKLSEAAARVIELSGKVRDYYDAELPKYHPDYPLVNEGEEEPPPPPEEAELRAFLERLPREQILQLLLIVNVVRGFCSADDLAGAYEALKSDYVDTEEAVSEMADMAALADNLSFGLEDLQSRGIEVDKMPLRKQRSRKG
jgi:hypothetical protein